MADLLAAEGLARFGALAARQVDSGQVPGLVAIAARGGHVHAEVAGSLSVGGPPVQRDSIFRIASITKPMTAVATLILAAEGLLDLDEPVDRLVPELAGRRVLRRIDGPLDDTVPARRAITVRDLLTFTFGFGSAAEMQTAPEPFPVMRAASELHLSTLGAPNPAEQPDPDTWIAGLGSLPLLAQPGERWLYNTGASVLGVLLARAAGQPFGTVLRTRLFEPLGMRDTGFWTSQTDRLATAYRSGPDGPVDGSRAGDLVDRSGPGGLIEQPRPGGLVAWDQPGGAWSAPRPFSDGASGLVSTADDLLAFSRMLLRGGSPLLRRGAVAEMTRDQLTPGQKSKGGPSEGFFDRAGWGFCVSVVTAGPDLGAFGWAGGFGTTWVADPARDLTVIVLTQRMFETFDAVQSHLGLQAAARDAADALP